MWSRGWVEIYLYSSMIASLKGVSGQHNAPAAIYPRGRTGSHFQKSVWASGPVLTGAQNLVPNGIRSCTVQLYRLSYLAHTHIYIHSCRWTSVSRRYRWQSDQSVCSRLSTVRNCRVEAIDLVTQRSDTVSACALFHVSDHLLVSLTAGEYKKTF